MVAIHRLVTCFLLVLLWLPAAHAKDCQLTDSDREAALELSFKAFDQTPGQGWRPLFEKECYAQAADLLEAYAQQHPDAVSEHYMLPFHTGQLNALAGNDAAAITWMQRGYNERQSKLMNWNAFVDAALAFLHHDRSELITQRARVNEETPMPDARGLPNWAVDKKMNLDVVDGYIACFDKSYAEDYGDDCRQKDKNLDDAVLKPHG